jgi:hypothetical protein
MTQVLGVLKVCDFILYPFSCLASGSGPPGGRGARRGQKPSASPSSGPVKRTAPRRHTPSAVEGDLNYKSARLVVKLCLLLVYV